MLKGRQLADKTCWIGEARPASMHTIHLHPARLPIVRISCVSPLAHLASSGGSTRRRRVPGTMGGTPLPPRMPSSQPCSAGAAESFRIVLVDVAEMRDEGCGRQVSQCMQRLDQQPQSQAAACILPSAPLLLALGASPAPNCSM